MPGSKTRKGTSRHRVGVLFALSADDRSADFVTQCEGWKRGQSGSLGETVIGTVTPTAETDEVIDAVIFRWVGVGERCR